jgi:hypothetical protein
MRDGARGAAVCIHWRLRMDHRLIFQRRAPIEHVLLNQRRRENAREASATGLYIPGFARGLGCSLMPIQEFNAVPRSEFSRKSS